MAKLKPKRKPLALPAPKLTTSPQPGGLVRVELNCATCDPCILVMAVPADAADPTKPDLDELATLVRNAGWTINLAKQPICPDCR